LKPWAKDLRTFSSHQEFRKLMMRDDVFALKFDDEIIDFHVKIKDGLLEASKLGNLVSKHYASDLISF